AVTFGELLERHEREIFAYALRLTGSRADADDLYQETFLAAFRGWPPPRAGNERAWLYKIATNKAIDQVRRARRVVPLDDLLLARAKREGLVTVGYDVMDSPLGPLWIAVGPRGVVNIHYGATPDARELARITRAYGPGVLPDRRACDRVLTELDQYFAGRRRSFDVQVDLATLTPFQQRILTATARVPYGELTTYKVVAREAGNEQASRAAGAALG